MFALLGLFASLFCFLKLLLGNSLCCLFFINWACLISFYCWFLFVAWSCHGLLLLSLFSIEQAYLSSFDSLSLFVFLCSATVHQLGLLIIFSLLLLHCSCWFLWACLIWLCYWACLIKLVDHYLECVCLHFMLNSLFGLIACFTNSLWTLANWPPFPSLQ